MRTRDEPTYPLAGLLVLLVVAAGFWSGVVMLAERFL